ncbi:MAG: hypothetical protein Q7O66_01610, partial [Dehalococcoidia bacterium]|nr:hypothetical protein [Dehalococcoidia bacterium]
MTLGVQLVHFEAARQQLALAHSVDEVKVIRDKHAAVQAYLKQQGASKDMQNQCAEIRLRAERRLGELLAEADRVQGERVDMTSAHREPKSFKATVERVGISLPMAKRWQLEATIPEEVFERHVAETKAKSEELTTASVLQLASRMQRQETIKDLSRTSKTLEA